MKHYPNQESWYKPIALLVAATLLVLVECEAEAAESSFPLGCKSSGYAFKSGKLVLKQDTAQPTQTLYFIHNHSEQTTHLHFIKDPKAFMNPKWSTDLSADHWAAFATDKDGVTFSCKSLQKKASAKVDCDNVLEICQYKNAKFATSNLGNYWVATDHTQKAAVQAAVQKGILLR